MPRSNKKSGGATPENQSPTVITPQSVEYVDGPQYSAFYSNNVGFAVNLLDFVLMFGETVEANPEKAIVERRARVTMHPTQAKVLAFLLLKNIEGYEKLNGKIAVPPGAIGIPSNFPHA
jgi:hypothetical protein